MTDKERTLKRAGLEIDRRDLAGKRMEGGGEGGEAGRRAGRREGSCYLRQILAKPGILLGDLESQLTGMANHDHRGAFLVLKGPQRKGERREGRGEGGKEGGREGGRRGSQQA